MPAIPPGYNLPTLSHIPLFCPLTVVCLLDKNNIFATFIQHFIVHKTFSHTFFSGNPHKYCFLILQTRNLSYVSAPNITQVDCD